MVFFFAALRLCVHIRPRHSNCMFTQSRKAAKKKRTGEEPEPRRKLESSAQSRAFYSRFTIYD